MKNIMWSAYRRKSQMQDYFPKSLLIPLIFGLLLTLAVIASKGFSDNQDIRSRAANTPTNKTPYKVIYQSIDSAQRPNLDSCTKICDAEWDRKVGDELISNAQGTSVGLNSPNFDNAKYNTVTKGACTTKSGYSPSSSLKTLSLSCNNVTRESTVCMCKITYYR